MASSKADVGGSDPTNNSSGSKSSTKTPKGHVHLDSLAMQRAKGVLKVVEFNALGQPFGNVAAQMQSYIGGVTREHVRLSYDNWRCVPEESSFVVPDTWEKRCLQSAAKKWREYKSTLYKKNILPYKHDHERLIQPPSGSKIKLDDWNTFVITRLSESSQAKSEDYAGRRAQNLYPHRMSRKGYANMRREMEEELTGDEEIDRAIMWKQARVNERGEFADEVLSQKVHQIDECIRQKTDGVLSRPHPDADILTHVLQKSDSRGHVRGLGGLVSPSTICITNKSSSSTNRKLLQEMAELRAIVSQLQQQQQVVPKNDDGEQKASCSAAQKSVDEFQIIDDAEFLEVRRPKKKGMSPPKLLAKLNAEELPRPLKNLVSYARKALNDGHSIPCIIDENVFGHVVNSYIFIEDIGHMCEKKPVTVSTICVYCWHLYKECDQQNLLHRIRFVDPNPLSTYVMPEQRGETIGHRLVGILPNQLVFVPINVGNHWMLFVVDPHAEIVYVLDPLKNPAHVGQWKGIMQMDLRMFNSSIGRRGRQTCLWEPIKCQQQPDGDQCGFYIMRYMKDIVDNLRSPSPIPINNLFDQPPYSTKEIDEVRLAWAEQVFDLIW